MLLFLSIETGVPKIEYVMRVVQNPEPLSKKAVKQIHFSAIKKLIILRMRSQDLLLIQLVGNEAYKSTVIERIPFQTK